MGLSLEEKLVMAKIKEHNVAYMEVRYDGGGDDGMIEDIEFYDINGNRMNVTVDTDKLDNFLYECISNNVEWDWVNNEGGYGMLTFNFNHDEIKIDHTQRVTEDHEYDVSTELNKYLGI